MMAQSATFPKKNGEELRIENRDVDRLHRSNPLVLGPLA